MALIKNKQTEHIVAKSFEDLGDLRRQAEEFVERAQAEAELTLARAGAEAQRVIDEAGPLGHAAGHERGLSEGREQGRRLGREEALEQYGKEIARVIEAWTGALERFEAERREMLLAAREDILEFALAMGRKITHRIIESDPTVIADQLVETLSLVAAPTAVTVSISPEDRARVEPMLGPLLERITMCTHISLRDDPELTPGGCVIATGRGSIDATIEGQIERIVEALLSKPADLRAAGGHPAAGGSAVSRQQKKTEDHVPEGRVRKKKATTKKTTKKKTTKKTAGKTTR